MISAALVKRDELEMKAEKNRNDTTSQKSVQEYTNQAQGIHPHEITSIAEICASVMKLVTAIGHSHQNHEGSEPDPVAAIDFTHLLEDQSDAIWDSICDFAGELAHSRASSLDDIAGKISVWRHLAPEANEDDVDQSTDEILARSIMEDVEHLRRAGGKALAGA